MGDEGHSGKDTIPIWLDCDPGHDDAFAIIFAAHHPALNLLGISTVHGNASLERTTANAGSMLTAIGRTDVPVYPGARKPFCRKAVYAPGIHGTTGLDGTILLPKASSAPIIDANAILAMRSALLSQPKDTSWLVATGALTNVALLFATFPEVAVHIKGLSVMGGAVGGGFTDAPMGRVTGEGERLGNVTQWAEFNIYCDPEAAQSVFSNPLLVPKTTLIPLDVTHQVLATPEVLRLMLHGTEPTHRTTPSTLRQMLHDLLTFFAHTYAEVFGLVQGPPLHDPLAVAAIFPDHSEHGIHFDDRGGERWAVEVVTDGLHSDVEEERGQVGRTRVSKAQSGEVGVRIPRGLNVQGLWSLLEGCVKRAEERSLQEVDHAADFR